jgi:phage tail-like protein
MTELTFTEAYRSHGFVFEVGAQQLRVTKVTGLSDGITEAIDQVDGGDTIVHKVPSGLRRFDPLIIERNVDGSPQDRYFRDWFTEVFEYDPNTRGSTHRRNGSVIKLENGHEVFRIGFFGAWIVSCKLADFDVSATTLLKQTVELSVDRLERL